MPFLPWSIDSRFIESDVEVFMENPKNTSRKIEILQKGGMHGGIFIPEWKRVEELALQTANDDGPS